MYLGRRHTTNEQRRCYMEIPSGSCADAQRRTPQIVSATRSWHRGDSSTGLDVRLGRPCLRDGAEELIALPAISLNDAGRYEAVRLSVARLGRFLAGRVHQAEAGKPVGVKRVRQAVN